MLGLLVAGLPGCGDDGGGDEAATAAESETSPASAGATEDPSDPTSDPTPDPTSDPTEDPMPTTGDDPTGSATSSSGGTSDDDTEGGSDTDTGGALGYCGEDPTVLDFEVAFNSHQIDGDDLTPNLDSAQACLSSDGSAFLFWMEFASDTDADQDSTLRIRVDTGIGEYDLATDAGTPGSGVPGDVMLSYTLFVEEEATDYSYNTTNTAATGTLNVASVPAVAGESLRVQTTGAIADWSFSFTVDATMP